MDFSKMKSKAAPAAFEFPKSTEQKLADALAEIKSLKSEINYLHQEINIYVEEVCNLRNYKKEHQNCATKTDSCSPKKDTVEQLSTDKLSTDNMDNASTIILKYYLPEQYEFTLMTDNANGHYWGYTNLYFFFKSELDLKKEDEKANIRHLRLYYKGFYDYIAKKKYKCLSEWAADNGKTLDDILYGMNRDVKEYSHLTHSWHVKRKIAHIPLMTLIKHLEPSYTGEYVPTGPTEAPPAVNLPVVQPVKNSVTIFEFDALLTQLYGICETIESMKLRLD